ncbi:gliding motility lipoprotein GldB [Bacteroidota bacterium]
MYRIGFIFIFLFSLISCKNRNQCIPHPDIGEIKITLELDRLELEVSNLNTEEELADFLNSHRAFKEFFLDASKYPDETMLLNNYSALLKNPGIDTVYAETQSAFNNFQEIELDFIDAFSLIKYYYPEFKPPKIQTAITGLIHDQYVSDSVIIIGLDYFVGKNATYRPMMPDYIRNRFKREAILPNTILLLSNQYNLTDHQDNTLLAEMIFYGKAYYFTKQILPCTSDSLIIGYTKADMRNIERGKEIIWANFIENQALFETSHIIKEKFISERPKTFEIGEDCPGRIGRWVGWQIVKAYMDKNPEVSLDKLMKNDNAREIFNLAKYKPRR